MITLNKLCFKYDEAQDYALSDISLTIKKGEMLAIVGHNGSGKSTLAKQFNGLLLPSSGHVIVDGIDTKDADRLLEVRQRVGMVFQNPDNQLVTTVVEEDVAFGPESLGVPSEEIRKRVDYALAAVNMTNMAQRAPHMLSGGQKQRVAIAGMLAMQPQVLVLDEATSMLDPEGRDEVLSIVRELNREHNITVIMITQIMEEAALFDRVAVLKQGRLVALGTPGEIFRDAVLLQNAGLDVPMTVRVRNALIEGGMNISGEPISIEETALAISNALKNRAE